MYFSVTVQAHKDNYMSSRTIVPVQTTEKHVSIYKNSWNMVFLTSYQRITRGKTSVNNEINVETTAKGMVESISLI